MTSWNEGFRTFRRNLQVTGSEIILLSKSSNIVMNFKFNQNHLSASQCHSVSIEDRECLSYPLLVGFKMRGRERGYVHVYLFFLNFIFCIQLVIFSTTFHDCSDRLCFKFIQYLNVDISFVSVTLLYLMSILPLVSLLQ